MNNISVDVVVFFTPATLSFCIKGSLDSFCEYLVVEFQPHLLGPLKLSKLQQVDFDSLSI